MCKRKYVPAIDQTKKRSARLYETGTRVAGIGAHVPLSRSCRLQMNCLEDRVRHENRANGFPLDCVCRSRLKELTLGYSKLFFGIMPRKYLQLCRITRKE